MTTPPRPIVIIPLRIRSQGWTLPPLKGAWAVESTTKPGHMHTVEAWDWPHGTHVAWSCTCEAGARGVNCRHIMRCEAIFKPGGVMPPGAGDSGS